MTLKEPLIYLLTKNSMEVVTDNANIREMQMALMRGVAFCELIPIAWYVSAQLRRIQTEPPV
jgi:hypothetical protein